MVASDAFWYGFNLSLKKKSKMKYSSLQTSEPSSNFLHSSFFFLRLETTGWTHECSRLESIVILHK